MIVLVITIAHCQLPIAQQSAFVSRLGTDTIAVETFSRSSDSLTGSVLTRYPRAVRRQYAMRLDAGGRAVSGEIRTFLPRPDTTDTMIVNAFDRVRGSIRSIGDAWGPWELLTVAARRANADSLRLWYWSGGPDSTGVDIVRIGRDTLVLRDFQVQRARVDGDGRLLSMVRPEQQYRVERVPVPHLGQLWTQWTAREQREGQAGILSPLDSVQAQIAGATIRVVYSRPSKRGRQIFGRAVPWNEVWRTGANNATRLTTSHALDFGGVMLPAGAYALFTIPGEQQWQLIISRDTASQGGHDPALDLYRLDLRTTRPPRVVEQLTIAVQPEGAGGVLRISWDMIEASIPFTVSR